MGLLSGGGFQYYAGPDGLSGGVNSFADNFMKQFNSGREMKMKQAELEMMNKIRMQQLAQLQAEQTREQGFQKALQSGIMPTMSENNAVFEAQTKNPNIVGYKTMPSGKQAAVLTDEGNQQIQGLMQGGFDSSKAMAAAMPYTKAEQFPQMLTAMKTIEMMPVEQRLKILEMLKTQSEINKNNETWSDPYVGVVGGKKVLLRKNSHGKVEQVSQDTSTTIHNYPQKDFKPTEGDLRYAAYKSRMVKQGKVPQDRDEFDIYYYGKTEGIKQENKEKSIEAGKKPWERSVTPQSSPARLTYDPTTGTFK